MRRAGSAGRALAALCVTTLAASSLAACSGDEARVTGREWQVTDVYDDPALPTGVPADTVPPTITLGRESYTGTSACGSFQGTLVWLDGQLVDVGKPVTVREGECSPAERTFDDRLRAQLPGRFLVEGPEPGLRVSAVGERVAGQAAPGWAAVTPE